MQQGHACRHVGDIGLGQANDWNIIQEARNSGEIILTHDLDYGTLLAFSGDVAPSVIIFRLRNVSVDNLLKRLAESLPSVQSDLAQGAIVVIEDALVRVRRLPIITHNSE
ncbi:MAG: DUF5615 family PIN-like protein [Fimbriimonadales bacterium]|nr:DUF5615 family PIN-like protein [Fimbriimonadales bacterium]